MLLFGNCDSSENIVFKSESWFPSCFFSLLSPPCFFLTYTLVTLSLHWAVTQLWLQSGPGPQTVTVNQSIMTSGKVKQTTITTATNSVRLWQARLVWRVWPGTDHRDTKGTLLGDLKRSEVPFWKQQKINGVGGWGPEGSMLYLNKKVKFKGSPTGGDIRLTHRTLKKSCEEIK